LPRSRQILMQNLLDTINLTYYLAQEYFNNEAIFFLGLSIFFLFSGIIESQAQYTPQNALRVNLLGIGGFSVAPERAFTDNKSVVLTGRFIFFDFKDIKTFTFSGLGVIEVDYSVDLQLVGYCRKFVFISILSLKKTLPKVYISHLMLVLLE
jgi:hypothetical protein